MAKENRKNYKIMSLSMDPILHSHLAWVAERLQVSRSALAAEILRDTIEPMVQMLGAVPENPTPQQVKRFRGESEQYITELYAGVMQALEKVPTDD